MLCFLPKVSPEKLSLIFLAPFHYWGHCRSLGSVQAGARAEQPEAGDVQQGGSTGPCLKAGVEAAVRAGGGGGDWGQGPGQGGLLPAPGGSWSPSHSDTQGRSTS